MKAKPVDTRRGGNRRGEGVKYRGDSGRAAADNRVYAIRPKGSPGDKRCSICARDVPLRADGTISTHRVGPTRRLSWLCLGTEDRAVPVRPEVKVGARFVHARQLDLDWRPGRGQRFIDAPHVIMRVTSVRRGGIYYRPDDAGTKGLWWVEIDRVDTVVGRWLP